MMPTLREEDRRAVDLLLDHAARSSAGKATGNSSHGFSPANGMAAGQLSGVQAVLNVLDILPGEEPPPDLAARTLRRIDAESSRQDPGVLRAPQPDATAMMPHA